MLIISSVCELRDTPDGGSFLTVGRFKGSFTPQCVHKGARPVLSHQASLKLTLCLI